MSFQYFKPGLTDLRALLVIAALLSLCISSNVGPRLLPLPDVIDRVEEQCEKKVGISRSRGPQAESFRVPMMAQRRADREAPQPLAALPKIGFVSPNEARFAAECSQQSFFFYLGLSVTTVRTWTSSSDLSKSLTTMIIARAERERAQPM